MKKGDVEINTILIFILVLVTIIIALVIAFLKGKDIIEGIKNFLNFFK